MRLLLASRSQAANRIVVEDFHILLRTVEKKREFIEDVTPQENGFFCRAGDDPNARNRHRVQVNINEVQSDGQTLASDPAQPTKGCFLGADLKQLLDWHERGICAGID